MLITFKGNHNVKEGSIITVNHNNGILEFSGATVKSSVKLTRDSYKAVVREVADDTTTVSVERYAHLHGHSDFSLLDGMSKVKDYVALTTTQSALTDHGNLYGMVEFYKTMKKAGKKAIIAFEGYVEDPLDKKLKGMHTCFFAKDITGYKNLLKLCSEAFDHTYRGKPHLTSEIMERYHEGIIVSAACLGGPIQKYLADKNKEAAEKVLNHYIDIFGKENFYLEVQRHHMLEERIVELGIIELSEKYDIPIICTTDSHYSRKEDKAAHEVLLCLQTGKTLDQPHMRFEGDGYWIHTSEEVESLFHDHPEWLDNTLALADRCDVKMPLGDINLPSFEIPAPFKSETEYFEHLCITGYEARFKGTDKFNDTVYRERYSYELEMIKQMGFISYFLIVQDYIAWAREHDIYVGPGRGSAAGSLIAYCIGITDLDPIELNLLFERFLNPERVSMPDVDTDFEHSKRGKVIDYVKKKYGENNVCSIITFGTMAAKMSLKDVARVLGLPAAVGAELAKMVPEGPKITLKKALEMNPELRGRYESDHTAKEVIDIAMAVEGCKRHSSQHACFDKDTLITTKQGLKRIIDVQIGDFVLTHENRYRMVVDTMETHTDTVYTVKCHGTPEIHVTGNHPMLVREQHGKNKERWKSVDTLSTSDYIGVPINYAAIIPDIAGVKPEKMDDFWWMVGYHMSNHFDYTIDDTEPDDVMLNDYLKSVKKQLEHNQFPGDILNLPMSKAKLFLDGVFAASMDYDKNGAKGYFTPAWSETMALGIHLLIHKTQRKVALHLPCVKNDEGKYQLFFNPNHQEDGVTWFVQDNLLWVKVMNITKEKKEQPMYNLTVLDDSSYQANGLAAHNCGLVVAPSKVDDYLPTSLEKNEETGEKDVTSQVTMTEVEELSLLKMDVRTVR